MVKPTLKLIALFALGSIDSTAENAFNLREKEQKELVIQIDGKTVGRYMFDHDASSKKNYTKHTNHFCTSLIQRQKPPSQKVRGTIYASSRNLS
jgi:hypothetical protein